MPTTKPGWPKLYDRAGGPAAWWLLEGPRRTAPGDAGDVADLTGNSAAGTRGATATWAAGPLGRCLAFDGTTSASVTTGQTALNPAQFSVRFRFKSTSAVGQPFVSKITLPGGISTGTGWAVYLTSGKLAALAQQSSGTSFTNPTTTATFNDGNWHDALVVFGAGFAVSIYVDGARQAVTNSSAGTLSNIASTAAVMLGTTGRSGDGAVDGQVDDVRIYDYALAAPFDRLHADPFWRLAEPDWLLDWADWVPPPPVTLTLTAVARAATAAFALGPYGADFERALAAWLKSSAAVAALAGTRVYPGHVPEGSTLPAVSYRVRTRRRPRTLDGPCGIAEATVVLACRSKRDADVKALLKALRALDGLQGPLAGVAVIETVLRDDGDDYEQPPEGSDLGTHDEALTFLFRYREP